MNEYKKVQFEEHVADHAGRLGVDYNFVRTRRRLLIEKLGGPPARDRSGSVQEWLRDVSAEELMATLCVRQTASSTSRDEPVIRLSLVPMAVSLTADLAAGKFRAIARRITGAKWGGEGLPRDDTPPYGYRRSGDEWVADPPAADAIVDAFCMMVDPTFHHHKGRYKGSVRWSAIAEALNEDGYCRKDGQEWRGDDVRSLIRTPTYCGYVYYQKTTGEVKPAQHVQASLVDPQTFLAAVKLGRGTRKGMGWVEKLEALLRAKPPGAE